MQRNNGWLVGGFFALCGIAILADQRRRNPEPALATNPGLTSKKEVSKPPSNALEITIATSDGKKDWIEEVAASFNARLERVGERPVYVRCEHVRSGESIQDILAGRQKPHLWSPASRSWIERMNQTWTTRTGHAFVADARPTVRTALVIATWEPMARALGWPDRALGWDDLVKVATDEQGWAALGHPEWGAFKFGHAHPDFSTSAMLSLVSLLHAETGKSADLVLEDLAAPKVIDSLAAIEKRIVHYGESSSWLTRKMCDKGPAYLSAVPLYESSVVKANEKFPNKAFPLVAIYPREGTFWEEHPTGVVNADWVTPDHALAARKFLDFMTAPEQQAKTIKSGFRPADPKARLGAPIDRAHGVDPDADQSHALANPSDEVFQRANELWHQTKKKSTVYLLVDTSGSMQGEPMAAAKRGAERFLQKMEPDDEVVVISFNTFVSSLGNRGRMRDVGERTINAVRGLFAEGNTSLHDALARALDEIEQAKRTRKEPRLYGVVLLSDGKDTSSTLTRQQLLAKLPKREDSESTKIFTIGYGPEADHDLLKEIADRTNAIAAKGEQANVEKIYLTLSSYF